MRLASKQTLVLALLLAPLLTPASVHADPLPQQVYFSTINFNTQGIAVDNTGAAYLVGIASIAVVSPQGSLANIQPIPGASNALNPLGNAIAVNPANGAAYVSWIDFPSINGTECSGSANLGHSLTDT